MHRTEPAQAHQLRHAARVVAIGLHRHRLQRRLDVPRLNQDRRKPRRRQPGMQPLRQRARLQTDPSEPRPVSFNNVASSSGSLATFVSRTIFPVPSTMHTLLSSSDTSIAA
jgi:hypothetical protein